MGAATPSDILRSAIADIEARGLRMSAMHDPERHGEAVSKLLAVLLDFNVPFTVEAPCTEGYAGYVVVKVKGGREGSNADVLGNVPAQTGLLLALIRAMARANLTFKAPG